MKVVSKSMIQVILLLIFITILIVLINVTIIIFGGENVPAPEIPREPNTIGSGESINYLILGDSTTIAQGGTYENGYVVGTAEELSKNYKVTYQNFGVSGATINDVLVDQLVRSKDFAPDIVLIAAGANDVTHLTSMKNIEKDTKAIIAELRSRNSDVKIVFTGSAAMGTVRRFPQPTRWIAGWQTDRINRVMERVVQENNVKFAYIARETKEKFADNPQFLAKDRFHPNNEGYAEWTKVLNRALAEALTDSR